MRGWGPGDRTSTRTMITSPRWATLIALLIGTAVHAEEPTAISSRVETTAANELILTQEVLVDASVAEVWEAYTTTEGWLAWVAPNAEVDLRAGGTIRTNYDPDARIGDPGTNTLHILNYVPERVLTLQAELSERWPDVMKEDGEHLMNVVLFDDLGAAGTRIRSYGVGYRADPAYDELMEFFIPANERLYAKLKAYLEER